MKIENLKFIDIFAGIGGFHQAFTSFGAKCVYASDIDRHCQGVYYNNYGIKPFGDITKIDPYSIPYHDILCAGFPCQPFSISGKQFGFEDSRGTLFFDIIRIIKAHKPKIIVLENVANLSRHNDSKTVSLMKQLLVDEGYNVFLKELNSCDFEVPQSRKRLYFVCFLSTLNIDNFSFPLPSSNYKHVIDILDNSDIDNSYLFITKPYTMVDCVKIPSVCCNKIMRIGSINKGGQGDRIYSPLGFGITLCSSSGGSASKTGAYLINNKIRKLSPRECARMQGFPENFILDSNINQAYKQFGNSVSIPVLRSIIKQIDLELQKH
jgi:DNA (cytosine-5)-methyltransferase 1